MYFKFDCPHCGKSLKVKEENAGQRARCPYCRNSMTVPEPPASEDDLDALSSAAVNTDDIPIARPRRKAAGGEIDEPHDGEESDAASRRRPQPAADSSSEQTDGTNVSLLRSGVLGFILLVAFYGVLVLPTKGTAFADKFLKSGMIAPFLVFLLGWSVALLWLKQRKLRRQKESMLFDVLPNEISEQITPDKVDEFTSHIRSLPVKPGESFLINRVLRGLEHFRILRSNSEVASRLAVQSDIDAAAVESSYTIVKVFIWAIPILGFIGTVMGISEAVSAFSGKLSTATGDQGTAAITDSLNQVVSGLAFAFDTTFVALVMSIIVMFPTSLLQKSEEDLINWVDEYTNENLLKRLKDSDLPDGPDNHDAAIDRAVEKAMVKHHAELQAWTAKLETIGRTVTDQVVKGWDQINEKAITSMATKHQSLLTQIDTLMQQMAKMQDEQVSKMQAVSDAVESTAKVNDRRTSDYQKIFEQDMDQLAEKLEQVIERVATQTTDTEQQMSEQLRQTSESVRTHVEGLEAGISSLNRVLEQLGEKQVVIRVEQPERKRWFFGRRNGA
ncbi:MAG: hypothetical protein GC159_20775 [Phycisphaera sp.]|nr:hypothetical protein [Phycisphaera sp.]